MGDLSWPSGPVSSASGEGYTEVPVACDWSAVEAVLGAESAPSDLQGLTLRFEETGALTPGEARVLTAQEYQYAVSERLVEFLQTGVGDAEVGVIRFGGCQLGTLGNTIATGRCFSSHAHVVLERTRTDVTGIRIHCDLTWSLTGVGFGIEKQDGLIRYATCPAAQRAVLLAGQVEDTYWARAWCLPPQLARVALLLMASVRPRDIAERLGLTLKTVDTYIERLFARTGLHGRSRLHLAALEAGRFPPAGEAGSTLATNSGLFSPSVLTSQS